MKKLLTFALLVFLSLLAFKNFAFAQPEAIACFTLYQAGDYRRAIEAGRVAVQKYPNNPYAHYCLEGSYYAIGEFRLAL